MDYQVMAKRYEKDFFRDMNSLNILPPTIRTLVTDHIPHIINFIQTIMDKGHAYRTPSGILLYSSISIDIVTSRLKQFKFAGSRLQRV